MRKLAPKNCATVLLRTCAVRVFHPDTNKCTLAYAQHDTASQATLISEQLKNELGLNVNTNRKIRIRTLAEQTSKSSGCTSFKLQSLATDEVFAVNNALVVPNFEEDEKTLPHAVNVKNLKHFKGVKIPTISNRKTIDILIGQSDKSLLAVIEERESFNAEEPNCVLTRLGPIASGGQVKSESPVIYSLKVQIDETGDSCRCEQLEREVSSLKQTLRELELEDEVVQPSRTEVKVRELVETKVKVVEGRYEIPMPLKCEIIDKLPNNCVGAVRRTELLRRSALKNVEMKLMLTVTFQEMITEGWILPSDETNVNNSPCWYLAFFVTRQDKPRVVFDGAATFGGMSLNQVVWSGVNLLNDLVKVLTRFRTGRYACMVDLSKCFFQVSVPENQRDLLRLVWYKNNDLEGETQVFQFTRHVMGH